MTFTDGAVTLGTAALVEGVANITTLLPTGIHTLRATLGGTQSPALYLPVARARARRLLIKMGHDNMKTTHLFRHLLGTLIAVVATAISTLGYAAPNQAPVATLTSPATGAKYNAPASISLSATASDPDGSVARVDFYNGSTVIASTTTAPYAATWNNVPAGTYILKATAVDNAGKAGSSATVTVTVIAVTTQIISPPAGAVLPIDPITVSGTFTGAADTTVIVTAGEGHSKLASITGNTFTADGVELAPGSNTIEVGVARRDGSSEVATRNITAVPAPLVVLTSPATFGPFPIPTTIALTAEALSPGGSISKVEFLDNGTVVGTVTSPPYTMPYTLTQAGTRSLYARATDAIGQATTLYPPVDVIVASAPPVVNLTSPLTGSSYRVGAPVPYAATASDPDGTIARVEFQVNGILVATVTTAPYTASVPIDWLGTRTVTARAIDNTGVATTRSSVSITGTANQSPAITLDQPSAGQTVSAGAAVPLAATASDNDGSIAKVEFFANGTLIATKTATPYTATWTAAGSGSITLTARATDNDGATTTSAAVTVTVVTNQAPTVTLTSPANGASFTAPTSVMLAATASDNDGTISKVEFFAGTQLLATLTAAPYIYTWNNVLPGNYTIIAKATDDKGTATSAQALISVGGTAVSITSPMNGQAFIAPASFTLTATASTSAGTITTIEYLDGTQSLGTFTGSQTPFTATLPLTGVTIGMHNYSAKATTSSGGIVTSAPVTVTIAAGPTVSLASPGNNSMVVAPGIVRFSAIADGAGATVSKVDYFNGTTLIGTATTPPFDFAWANVSAGSYVLKARVTSSAGLTSDSSPVSVSVNVINAPTVTVDPGQNGRTVNEESTLITGTVQTPPNSAVTVNGSLATVTDDGKFFVNDLPLVEGANALTVKVTTQDGQTSSQALNMTRMGSAGFKVSVEPADGFAPLAVRIKVEDLGPSPLTHGFERIEFDLNGDGTPDYIATSLDTANFTATFQTGMATIRVTIKARDVNQNLVTIYTTERRIYAFDPIARYNMVKGVYADMLARLTVGSVDQAVGLITETTREQFRAFFNSRGSNLAADVAALGKLESGNVGHDQARLRITRDETDGKFGYYVYLMRDGDGIWRVEGM